MEKQLRSTNLKNIFNRKTKILIIFSILGFAYVLACLFLFFRQRYLIYRPKPTLSMLPNASAFNLTYEDVWITISGSQEKLAGWWIPAVSPQEKFSVIPNEPVGILKSPQVMLYFCGIGNNIGDYNYLARIAAFRQLGFSVLAFDYRGYGRSKGNFPSESQVYEDAEAAWNYLRNERKIPADRILIYLVIKDPIKQYNIRKSKKLLLKITSMVSTFTSNINRKNR